MDHTPSRRPSSILDGLVHCLTVCEVDIADYGSGDRKTYGIWKDWAINLEGEDRLEGGVPAADPADWILANLKTQQSASRNLGGC